MSETDGLVRIGELSRRVGVGPDRLRAWERRYGLLRPVRTAGGFRLYSNGDEQRVRDMQAQLDRGLSAAEAARAVLASQPSPTADWQLHDLGSRLATALDEFDDVVANALIDRLVAIHGPAVAMRDVIFPYMRALGEAWELGKLDVGREHFASNLVEARLLGLVPSWDNGAGPRAVLACPSGEHHTLGLVGLGVSLRHHGWRVTYLGADTPIAMVSLTVETLSPQLVVLSTAIAPRLSGVEDELRALAASARLILAGAGADPTLAQRVGAEFFNVDPVTAAERLSARTRST
jgi:DNA-binding transcriptional MerR regulator